MGKKGNDYFRSLNALADYACQTADLLLSTIEGVGEAVTEQNLEKAKLCRRKAEVEGSLIRQRLKTDFITPLEREDIWAISFAIIDITEKAEEGMFTCCLFLQSSGLGSRHRDILVELSNACAASSREVEMGAAELKNHKDSAALSRCFSEVKKLRRDAEELVRKEKRTAAAGCLKFGKAVTAGIFEEASSLLLASIKACETAAMAMELASIKN